MSEAQVFPHLRTPTTDELRRATCFLLAGVVLFSGYGTLTPASLRCHLPGAVACPGGVLGPKAPAASPGSQWFNVKAYDYSFWIEDTTTGQNDTTTWDMYEGYTVHINATSYPPNPAVGGVNMHGVGIYSNSQGSLLSISAPVGSWSSGSFVVPSTAETGDQIYCTIYCGPGHGSQYLNNINIIAAPPKPTATASGTPTSGTAPLPVSFTGGGSGGTPPYTYAWNFGDGTTSTSQSPSHTYTSAGSYSAVLTLSDSAGQVAKASVAVTVSAGVPLSGTASASPSSGSAPLTVSFTASASGGTSPYTYAWDFGDGTNGTGASPSHTYGVAGSYTATVSITDGAGATATASTAISVSAPAPLSVTASADKYSGTAWLHVNFTASASGGSGTYNATWNFGDGSTGFGLTTSHVYQTAGSYTPQVKVVDTSDGRSGTGSTPSIAVSGGQVTPLKVSLSVNPTTGATPLDVFANASVSGGSGTYTAYAWTFGDTTTASGKAHVQHNYTSGGTFLITVTVQDSLGSSASAETNVTAVGLQLSVALNRTRGEVPFGIQATASVSGGAGGYSTVLWNWGDGTTSTGCASPCTVDTHVYTQAPSTGSTYTVTATVSDAAHNQATSTATVTVYPALAGNLTDTTTSTTPPFQVNFTLKLTGGSSSYPGPFLWTFGDGNTLQAGTHAMENYTSAGNYTVTVRAKDSLVAVITASTTITLTVQVSAAPGGGPGGTTYTSMPWYGIGNPSSTGLALLGLMALGVLFLIVTSPKRKAKAKIMGSTATVASGPGAAGASTSPEVQAAEVAAAAFAPGDTSKEAKIARAKLAAARSKAARAANASSASTSSSTSSSASSFSSPSASGPKGPEAPTSPEVAEAAAIAAGYSPQDTSKEAKIARAKLAAAKAKAARAAKEGGATTRVPPTGTEVPQPPRTVLPGPAYSPMPPTSASAPAGGLPRTSGAASWAPGPSAPAQLPLPPPPPPPPPPAPAAAVPAPYLGAASTSGRARFAGPVPGRGPPSGGAGWSLRAPIARLPPPSAWGTGGPRRPAPPDTGATSPDHSDPASPPPS